MKKIGIITTTRAEYGLLSPIIMNLRAMENKNFMVELIVSGTHLDERYGKTINEIESEYVRVDEIVHISTNNNEAEDISRNQAEALIKFTTLFSHKKYAAVVLLGDRYEMLAVAIAAGNTRTPIFHISGGDTTEGAMDEWIRHSITKISYIHFTTNSDSQRRVIQLGENPNRVYNFGSTSVDNVIKRANLSKKEALNSVGMEECRYAICTYHPVTLETQNVEQLIINFLAAIEVCNEIEFIITMANADCGGMVINSLLKQADMNIKNVHVFSSLGVERYLSLMKYSEFVLGNSSSGIIEAPIFKIPTINIGDRQRGRLIAESIINCKEDKESIIAAIKSAMSDEYKNKCKHVESLYGNGNSAECIAKKIYEVVIQDKIDLKKKFYDLGERG